MKDILSLIAFVYILFDWEDGEDVKFLFSLLAE